MAAMQGEASRMAREIRKPTKEISHNVLETSIIYSAGHT